MFKRKKPKARFFSLHPAVHTLHPITKAADLDRKWVKEERDDYRDRLSRCPVGKILETSSYQHPNSIGRCPAINSIMRTGYVVYAPADFKVHTNGDGHTILFTTTPFNPPSSEYVVLHETDVTKWLMDSSKDRTVDQVVKINTTWRVQADDDVVFLQTKVPFVNETRFSAVSGILDPRTAYEVNVQLLWHLMEGDTTVRAGTPLCCYVPMSRRMLEDLDMSVDVATPKDYKLEEEFIFTAYNEFPENVNTTQRQLKTNKILKKYWNE
jgi:hypothetical protein